MRDPVGNHQFEIFFVCRPFQTLWCVDSCFGFKDYSDLGVLYSLKDLFFARLIIKGLEFVGLSLFFFMITSIGNSVPRLLGSRMVIGTLNPSTIKLRIIENEIA